MKKILVLALLSCIANLVGCTQSKTTRAASTGCEDCDLMLEGIPKNISWQTNIAPENEPGEPMIIRGTIFLSDGKTPAPGVILYVYHTDYKGLYSPDKAQTSGKRHGHLRGWMKTGTDGRYEFRTIRPASYPNGKAPQHIHPLILEPGKDIYWIDEYLFEDDPNLTDAERKKQEKRGGSGVIALKKNSQGLWEGTRDIILGMNVPGYK